jgi:predicted PurR-regulated permease PerM
LSETAVPHPQPKSPVQPVEMPGVTGLMTLAVCVVVVVALYVARDVMIPITLAVLLSFVLAPLVGSLRRAGLGRAPAVIIAALVALGVVASLSAIIGGQVAGLANDIPRYTATIESKAAAVRGIATGRFFALIGGLGRRLEQAGGTNPPPQPASDSPVSGATPLPVELHQPAPTPLQMTERILVPILSPLATAAIVFIVTIFILLQQEDLRDRLIRLFGADDLNRATGALDEAAQRLSKYFLTQLALNTAFGIIIGIGLFFIGVPSPVLWAIVAALFRFVPYFGTFLSAGLPVLLAAAGDPGWAMLLWTAALFLITELAMGQAVQPLVYGHSTGLSPVSVVVSVIFWGWLWGPVGLILSMPLTLCLVVLGRHVTRLKFIDVVLGDRPALTPIESFYQRMLAGDPDEVQDYAEVLLRDRSLSSYYDEVALKGLQLAAYDAQRGLLRPEQINAIEAGLEALCSELADHNDVDLGPDQADGGPAAQTAYEDDRSQSPPSSSDIVEPENLPARWRSDAPILCVSGRGPLDRAASVMLAQLLGRDGFKARIVSHEAAGRDNIRSLDVNGVAMICMCYLEISGSPSHLRYLLCRLRHHIPGVSILIGIWPTDETVLNDDRLRAAIGADYFATSLRGAVDSCHKVMRDEHLV